MIRFAESLHGALTTTIKLDQFGQVMDGQHRLLACIMAAMPIRSLVARGVDRDVFPVLDTGKNRTPGDVIGIAGYQNRVAIASTARGLILIDPPYEAKDEFTRIAEGFAGAFAKWPTGSYLLWYPAKSRRATDGLAQRVAEIADTGPTPGKCLRLEFSVAPQTADSALVSTGLLLVNPPWRLASELKAILPELERPLGQGGPGRFRLEVPKP